jgi:cytoskeleton protein RodZ
MTSTRPVQEHAPEVPAESSSEVTFGTWLRRQREARGVGLREIADSTRISLRYLEALEDDRFDVLPALVFARGFLREYARVVGLDPDEVVNAYLLVAQGGALEEQAPPRAKRRFSSPWGYGLLLAAAMVVLLGVAVVLSFWAERRAQERGSALPSVVPLATATASTSPGAAAGSADDLGEAPVPPAAESSVPGPEAAGVGEAFSGAGEAASGAAVAAPAGESAAVFAAPLVVEIRFRDDCWVEARVDGRRRPGELRVGGESVLLEAEEWVELTLGNRVAAEVFANGRRVVMPASPGNVVRGLRIDRPGPAAAAGRESGR